MISKSNLVECMSIVEDPRIERCRRHSIVDILVLSVLAVMCGADGWEDIELFARIRVDWLRKFIPLDNGVPSHDTIARVFSMIKPDAFQEAFLEWVKGLDLGASTKLIAIDGKTLRRSHDRNSCKNALHSVAAWCVENRVVLGLQSVDAKSNEITAIPKLLELLELKGAIVTMDAMGSQKEIAAQIVDAKGDYVMAIKDNHPKLAQAMTEFFDQAHENDFENTGMRQYRTQNNEHSREENRYFYHGPIPECLVQHTESWKGAKSIGQIHNITMRNGKEVCEVRYYISSLDVGVKKFASAVRGHWSIENSLHWTLDVTFDEDRSRIRRGFGPDNFALLRRFAISILNQDTSKESMRKKRKRAAWDENYLLNALASII